jgi:hypothetical protein
MSAQHSQLTAHPAPPPVGGLPPSLSRKVLCTGDPSPGQSTPHLAHFMLLLLSLYLARYMLHACACAQSIGLPVLVL